MTELKSGDRIDSRYTLEERVGVGGFAEVWKAKDELLSSSVAIKLLNQEFMKRPDIVDDFKKEYTAFQDYRHPNIITARHFGMHLGIPYLVMEYCKAGSLDRVREHKRREGPSFSSGIYQFLFTEKEIVALLSDAAKGLAFLHQQRIIHGDVKPANILLSDNGTFALTDFGISQTTRHKISKAASTPKKPIAQDKKPNGTEAYLPPEAFSENPTKDDRSDIFALGVTVFEMATNFAPWLGTGGEVLRRDGKVPDLWKVTEEVRNQKKFTLSEQLCAVITACMNPKPEERPRAIDLYIRLGQLFPQYLQATSEAKDPPVTLQQQNEIFQAKMKAAQRLLGKRKFRLARNMYRAALESLPANSEAVDGWDRSSRLFTSRLAFWISIGLAASALTVLLFRNLMPDL